MNTTLPTTTTADAIRVIADISTVIELFANSQDVAVSSRDLYRRTVAGFFAWVEETGRTISALTVADIIAYKEQLLNVGKSSLTVASYINSIRRFYEWAEANKIYPNVAKGVHAPKRKQEFKKKPLSVAKVGELLRYEQAQSARDYAIVNLCVRTGLRCIEVVRANVSDITYIGEQRVLMVQGKGRVEKDNFVILTDAAYKPIAAYLSTRKGTDANAPLFVSESNRNTGGRMTTRAVSGVIKAGLKNVGLDNRAFSAHSLRHTAGTNVLRAGGSIEQAQYMLRHSNPATTQIYTATLREEQRLSNGGETLLDNLYSAVVMA
jgi:integrase/recombinase XerC/integrase/recombinase XerD